VAAKKHVMVDIETLSTKHNAAVLSIGACEFDEDGARYDNPFLVSIPHACYDHIVWNMPCQDYHKDKSTLEWWARQSEEAVEALEVNLVQSRRAAATAFAVWFASNGLNTARVWANGPQFDCVILRNLFDREDVSCPWHFRDERDCRTLYSLFMSSEVSGFYQMAQDAMKEAGIGNTSHRADHDAIRQAEVVRAMLEELGV